MLHQWFEQEHKRQRQMAEDVMLTPVDSLGSFLDREQVLGTLSQMRLTKELFGRLDQQLQTELRRREQSQQPNR